MYALADSTPPSRSVLMRFLVRSWEYRRPRLWVGVRIACGIFNVVLGIVLLASVYWLGSLTWLAALPLAGAVLIFWDRPPPAGQCPGLAGRYLAAREFLAGTRTEAESSVNDGETRHSRD